MNSQFSHVIRVRFSEVDIQGRVFNAHWMSYFDDAFDLAFDASVNFRNRLHGNAHLCEHRSFNRSICSPERSSAAEPGEVMNKDQVASWLQRYVAAWKTYDRSDIADLFSEDALYRYRPYDDPVRGREAIVESWLEGPDDPGTYEANYAPIAVDGDVAVATGESTYRNADGSLRTTYDNCFVMRFDGAGRCKEFTEWFMERKPS